MSTNPPFLLVILLLAIGLRTVMGAPCCVPLAQATQLAGAEHAYHHESEHEQAGASELSGHGGHEGDPSANPCCSACGPTLPPEVAALVASEFIADLPEQLPIRALATRPPFPAYDARGPPLRV